MTTDCTRTSCPNFVWLVDKERHKHRRNYTDVFSDSFLLDLLIIDRHGFVNDDSEPN